MNYDAMVLAVEDARRTNLRFENQIRSLAKLLKGHLRSVNRDNGYYSTQTLVDLKRELTQFNAATRKWKS